MIYNRGGGRERGGEVLVEASPHFHPPPFPLFPDPPCLRERITKGLAEEEEEEAGERGGREGIIINHAGNSPPPFPLPLLSFFSEPNFREICDAEGGWRRRGGLSRQSQLGGDIMSIHFVSHRCFGAVLRIFAQL